MITQNELDADSLETRVDRHDFFEREDGDLENLLDFDVQLALNVD